MDMKKIGLILVGFILIVMCASCHFSEKCPAYASNDNQTEQNA
mgnify:FL=1